MNRREMFKKSAGIVGAVAALPIVSRLVEEPTVYAYGGATCAPECNAPTPPPLDTRTPEQVWEDSRNRHADYIIADFTADYKKYNHEMYTTESDIFDRVEAKLIEQHIPYIAQTIQERQCLVVNGNVLSPVLDRGTGRT